MSNEVFRGRYRNGIEKPSAIVPGKVEEYVFSLHTQNYTFRKGHRIMVQVQSTWFPLIDRNPQTYVESIFFAKPEAYRAKTMRVHRGGADGSRVDVMVERTRER